MERKRATILPLCAALRVALHAFSFLAIVGLLSQEPARADAAAFEALVQKLGAESYSEKAAAVEAMAATGEPRALEIIKALAAGVLYRRKSDGMLVVAVPKGGGVLTLNAAASGAAAGEAPDGELEAIGLNNRVRRAIDSALGALTLLNADPAERIRAANSMFKSPNAATALPALDAALKAETNASVRTAFERARAAVLLASSDSSIADRVKAIDILQENGGQDVLGLLENASASKDEAVAALAKAAVERIRSRLALWSLAQNAWYGLSLGSVLLLAAIGLAITFGVMGVINMAHGEMVMIGAYATFVVQEGMRLYSPGLLDYSLLVALPLAFAVTGAIGIAIERGIISFLYGRPLETLLATFGLSLIIQQAVRTIFGPTNREVSAPSWMSGAFEVGGLSVTYGRLWIIVFALAVFVALQLLLKLTSFGLQMRAVTQNRGMASSMGIRTRRVDAMAFGLGSGIAGIAGVALSQIDNVSPNLGQSYIIDSFMVVVFGGVGNLTGTLVAALTLGVANKFLEPLAGAVLAKILMLVFIILFIQKRPRGLFALKGRSVEA
ncbi:MAG: urea ABC transporter permease subunit UrtB [Hyphomicrobium sp.]|jgi:urea transport system permease protein